jgi:hypothetical protein
VASGGQSGVVWYLFSDFAMAELIYLFIHSIYLASATQLGRQSALSMYSNKSAEE